MLYFESGLKCTLPPIALRENGWYVISLWPYRTIPLYPARRFLASLAVAPYTMEPSMKEVCWLIWFLHSMGEETKWERESKRKRYASLIHKSYACILDNTKYCDYFMSELFLVPRQPSVCFCVMFLKKLPWQQRLLTARVNTWYTAVFWCRGRSDKLHTLAREKRVTVRYPDWKAGAELSELKSMGYYIIQ